MLNVNQSIGTVSELLLEKTVLHVILYLFFADSFFETC